MPVPQGVLAVERGERLLRPARQPGPAGERVQLGGWADAPAEGDDRALGNRLARKSRRPPAPRRWRAGRGSRGPRALAFRARSGVGAVGLPSEMRSRRSSVGRWFRRWRRASGVDDRAAAERRVGRADHEAVAPDQRDGVSEPYPGPKRRRLAAARRGRVGGPSRASRTRGRETWRDSCAAWAGGRRAASVRGRRWHGSVEATRAS